MLFYLRTRRLYRLLVAAGSAHVNLPAGGAVKEGGAKSCLWTPLAVRDAGHSPNEVRFVDAGDLGHQRVVGVGVTQQRANGQKDWRREGGVTTATAGVLAAEVT